MSLHSSVLQQSCDASAIKLPIFLERRQADLVENYMEGKEGGRSFLTWGHPLLRSFGIIFYLVIIVFESCLLSLLNLLPELFI